MVALTLFRSIATAVIGVAACAGSLPSQAENAGLKIDLHPEATVDHARVVLGDIASVSGSDADTLSEWRQIPLGAAPRPGRTAYLDRDRLQRWIRSYLTSRQTAIQWSGAQGVEISAVSKTLPGAQIAMLARTALQDWLSGRASHTEITQSNHLRDISIPDGALHLTVRPMAEGARPARRMQLWVDVWVDDAFIRAVPVDFSVQAYQTAYVARQGAATGSIVHMDDFEKKEIDLADPAKQDAVVVRDDASPLRLKRGVAQGAALLQSQVQPVPAVMRGQSATLHSRIGMVELESKVEVLQDGFPGQMVKVKPASASESILARVTGAGLLEMTER